MRIDCKIQLPFPKVPIRTDITLGKSVLTVGIQHLFCVRYDRCLEERKKKLAAHVDFIFDYIKNLAYQEQERT